MSETRVQMAEAFLRSAGWGAARRTPLAGDASSRRYERLTDRPTGNSVVFMDAAPASGQDIVPFLNVGRHLSALDLSAPQIVAQDVENGFVLLEDLGDDLFARVSETTPEMEEPIYRAAIDMLVVLHQSPAPKGLIHFNPHTMAQMVTPAFDWYGRGHVDDEQQVAIQTAFVTALAPSTTIPPVLALRDFHAENLIWLPDRQGVARVGLLDFQDAVICHPAYDLVSLTEDARRDVAPDLAGRLIEYYLAQTGLEPAPFRAAAAAIAAQRNLRIIGVFSRLSLQYDKPSYIDFIPRVWAHLMRDLAHPDLHELGARLLAALPEPTPEHLAQLRDKCGTIPKQ